MISSFQHISPKTKRLLILWTFGLCIAGIALYTTQAVQVANLPFWDTRFKELTYLATKITDCQDCNTIQYFWENKGWSACDISTVTLSSTLETAQNPNTKVINITSQPLTDRLADKWTNKYIFDQKNYELFAAQCHRF